MKFARVVGNVVATRKEEKVRGRKFMVIQPVNLDMEPSADVLVAVDAVGAGVGELVLFATGSTARQTHLTENRPTDCVIMAIVDLVDIDGDSVYNKSDEEKLIAKKARQESKG
ncbi:MAG: EutN/CcmL family microcompartment protein [bacterium]